MRKTLSETSLENWRRYLRAKFGSKTIFGDKSVAHIAYLVVEKIHKLTD